MLSPPSGNRKTPASTPQRPGGISSNLGGGSSHNNNNSNSNNNNNSDLRNGGSFLTRYFLVILFAFACLSLALNSRFTHVVTKDVSTLQSVLEGSVSKNKQRLLPRAGQQLKQQRGQDVTLAMPPKGKVVPIQRKEEEKKVEERAEDEEDEDDEEDEEDEKNEEKNGAALAIQNNGDKIQDQKQKQKTTKHSIADLNCIPFGGPPHEDAQEMVYWEDIPQDAQHMSPFHPRHPERDGSSIPMTQFLTFEPDGGGWNNIRMAMETVLTMAFAMGRTLVLPPHQRMYLLTKEEKGQRAHFSFDHFFHMESISDEHVGLDIITMKEFLTLVVDQKVIDPRTNTPIGPPPNGRVDWDGCSGDELNQLKHWLRHSNSSQLLFWDPEDCLAAFPATTSEEDRAALAALPEQIKKSPGGFPHWTTRIGKPQPVNAPPIERLKEMNAERTELCIYTPELQAAPWVHFPVGMVAPGGNPQQRPEESRLLVHFYAFLFFQDWKQDLWMKRFVRDHVRYIDELQCAAGRIVAALRRRVKARTNGASSDFDTAHIRRGDFQYKDTRVDAPVILGMLQRKLTKNTTLYIATDERDKAFFKPIQDEYDVVFMDDFIKTELVGVNTNYYGMIDQLVASRGRIFYGCWFSTFTGYINRLRGYHADDDQVPGFREGIIPNTYYYALEDRFEHMQEFYPVKKSFYAREFPTSWRLIDASLDESLLQIQDKVQTTK